MKRRTKFVIKTASKLAARTAKKYAVKAARDIVLSMAEDIEGRTADGALNERATAYTMGAASEGQFDIILRSMTESDRPAVLELMRSFYTSEAVLTDGSEEIYNNDITACVSDSPYLEGFVFTYDPHSEEPSLTERQSSNHDDSSDGSTADNHEKANRILGYAMIAHSFSTEYGKPCIWIEDLYLLEEARGLGLASGFFDFLASEYPDSLHRLEAELGNAHAMEVYKSKDFREMPYVEMYREP